MAIQLVGGVETIRISQIRLDMDQLKLLQQSGGGVTASTQRKREREFAAESDRPLKGRAIEVKDEDSTGGQRVFPQATLSALALCAICLGEHADVHKCSSATM